MTIPDDLLNDLRSSPTDLARIVEAVVRDRRPYVKIPVQTVRSWERRAPDDWAKVAGKKGEKIVHIRTISGGPGESRQIETITTGHYL